MKVSVDAKELDKAFNAVANARNHFTEQNYAMQQLQTACNILGPMWVHGVNEIESKENLEDSINQQVSDSAYDFMNEPSCLVTKDAYSRVTVTGRDVDIKASWKVVGDTPGENADEITDDDRRWADEAIEKHLEKHDDSQIPVRSKEKNIQARG